MRFHILCSRTAHRLTQNSKDKHSPWTVRAPPYRFMWLSTITWLSLSFLWKLLSERVTMEDLTPKSNLCSRDRGYSGRDYRDCLSVCCNIFKSSQHYTHSSLTTGLYPQSLIKYAFDWTIRGKGSQPLGWKGTTSSGLHSGVCTMYMSSYLHVNPEVSQKGSRRRAL